MSLFIFKLLNQTQNPDVHNSEELSRIRELCLSLSSTDDSSDPIESLDKLTETISSSLKPPTDLFEEVFKSTKKATNLLNFLKSDDPYLVFSALKLLNSLSSVDPIQISEAVTHHPGTISVLMEVCLHSEKVFIRNESVIFLSTLVRSNSKELITSLCFQGFVEHILDLCIALKDEPPSMIEPVLLSAVSCFETIVNQSQCLLALRESDEVKNLAAEFLETALVEKKLIPIALKVVDLYSAITIHATNVAINESLLLTMAQTIGEPVSLALKIRILEFFMQIIESSSSATVDLTIYLNEVFLHYQDPELLKPFEKLIGHICRHQPGFFFSSYIDGSQNQDEDALLLPRVINSLSMPASLAIVRELLRTSKDAAYVFQQLGVHATLVSFRTPPAIEILIYWSSIHPELIDSMRNDLILISDLEHLAENSYDFVCQIFLVILRDFRIESLAQLKGIDEALKQGCFSEFFSEWYTLFGNSFKQRILDSYFSQKYLESPRIENSDILEFVQSQSNLMQDKINVLQRRLATILTPYDKVILLETLDAYKAENSMLRSEVSKLRIKQRLLLESVTIQKQRRLSL
jgi:hypothetical protein